MYSIKMFLKTYTNICEIISLVYISKSNQWVLKSIFFTLKLLYLFLKFTDDIKSPSSQSIKMVL